MRYHAILCQIVCVAWWPRHHSVSRLQETVVLSFTPVHHPQATHRPEQFTDDSTPMSSCIRTTATYTWQTQRRLCITVVLTPGVRRNNVGVSTSTKSTAINTAWTHTTMTVRNKLQHSVHWKWQCMAQYYNNRISIAPYGRNFRGAGGRSDKCSVKAWLNSWRSQP